MYPELNLHEFLNCEFFQVKISKSQDMCILTCTVFIFHGTKTLSIAGFKVSLK